MHKFNYTDDLNSSDKLFFKFSEGFIHPRDYLADSKNKLLSLRVIKEEQDEEKLRILKEILTSINLENKAEKIKANNEFYSEELENSRLKNEILNLESQILGIKGLETPGKTFEDHKVKNNLSDLEKFSQATHSVSLKNIGYNLHYLEEKLVTLQTKTHKSHLKLNFYKNKYSHRIPELKKSLNALQNRIETLESESFHSTFSLQSLQSQNNSLTLSLNSKKSTLSSLRRENRKLFKALSILQSKIIKKPIIYPV